MNSTIKIDMTELLKLVNDLQDAGLGLNASTAKAVNLAATEARKDTTRQIVSQVFLNPTEVDKEVVLETLATAAKPQATIEVKDNPRFLTTYDTTQKSVANVWTAAKYAAVFGTVAAPARLPGGKVAQWIPRTGDPLRNITQGSKAAGLHTRISANRSPTFKHAFTMPILSGKSFQGRWGTFVSHGANGNPKGLYGPSSYQVTKGVWRDREDYIADLLEAAVSNEVAQRLVTEIGVGE